MEALYVCMKSVNPPPPSSDDEPVGCRLMALVRATEKSGEDDTELCELLTELISLYSRRGLLRGDMDKAQKIMESISSATTKASGGHSKRDPSDSNASTTTDDESLVLSALIRILTPKDHNCLSSSVVALAADACWAITTHIHDGGQTVYANAEQESVLTSSRSLLTSLADSINNMASLSSRDSQQTMALIRCLRASTSLISLLGLRVSRSVVTNIRKVAWTALRDNNAQVQKSSALLLSVLPLTGADNKSPADGWSVSVMDSVAALRILMDAMALLRPTKTKVRISSEEIQSNITHWIGHVTSVEIKAERVDLFQCYFRAQSSLLVALLTREAYSDTTRVLMMAAKLPIENMLDLCETMIAFPSAAETLVFSTKKRLRMEVIENGLLSPAALVLEMANFLKCLGHGILDTAITAAGSSLLPFARQVMRITQASLLASSSKSLEAVLDPIKSAPRRSGNRQDWLQNSVILRTRAIKTHYIAICTLGASVMAGPLTNNEAVHTHNTSEETLSVSLVGGSLLEQLSWPDETNEDWATLTERVNLCITALKALSAMLTTAGGFLPLACRLFIDSIALTSLASLGIKTARKVATSPLVKVETLKLGCACLCTPWPDGAMSAIMVELQKTARICTRDCDDNVSVEATLCLRLCDSLSMPRVPALSIVQSRQSGHETHSAMSLIENLKRVREEDNVAKTVDIKSVHALEETPKRAEKAVKRRKVQTSIDEDSTNPKASQGSDEPTRHLMSLNTTQTVEKECPKTTPVAETSQSVAAFESAASDNVSSRAISEVIHEMQSQDAALWKAKAHEEGENILSRQTEEKMGVVASLKDDTGGDSSEDDGSFPEIITDGGPDEEDR